MAATPLQVVSHTRRVCSLYKKCLRNLQCWYVDRAVWRYHATVLRADFQQNRDEKDMIKAVRLVEEAEQELYQKQHYLPIVFPTSPGGVAHERNIVIPDSAVDYWDPVEKAQYPKYFETREQRKKEFVDLWQKKYGKVDPKQYEHGHH